MLLYIFIVLLKCLFVAPVPFCNINKTGGEDGSEGNEASAQMKALRTTQLSAE